MSRTRSLVAGLCLASALFCAPAAAGQAATEPVTGRADTLSLSPGEARAMALARNPAYLRELEALGVADAAMIGARTYPFNPVVELEATGDHGGGGPGEYRVSLGQEVEWPGSRGIRIEAARAGRGGAEMSVRDAARLVLADVTDAFHTAEIARRRADLARETAALAGRLLDVARLQAAAGEISLMEANLVEIEAGRTRAAVAEAERDASTALLRLRRSIGLPPAVAIELKDADEPPVPVDRLDPDSLVATALGSRPDLAADERAVDESAALARLARRGAIPPVRLSLFVEREAADPRVNPADQASERERFEDPRLGLALELPIPLFQRNRAESAERAARLEQARLTRDGTALAVRTEVLDAYQAYRRATEAAAVLERDVLGPARETARMLETALDEGEIGLPEFLLLRRQLVDAEMSHLDAVLARRLAFTRLEAAVGSIGDPSENDTEP